MCFVVSKRIGCKYVQAMFIDMKEAKPGTLGLLVSQLVGDEICAPRRLLDHLVCVSTSVIVCIQIVLPLEARWYASCHLISILPHVPF